uniref:Phosphoribosylaminoimidazole-succinocarboxamide synthase, chloroplastic n=1 Tax=Chlamydomonas leiostraca TaxID=1034604 RepID=A0A7S0S1R7_9CHLO
MQQANLQQRVRSNVGSQRRVTRNLCVTVRAASAPAVDSIKGVRPEVVDAISKATTNCLNDTNLSIGQRKKGKVRDTYDLGDKVVIVTTDRQSAFDRHLASIPFKGQVLNQTSAWWFKHTSHIVKNAAIAMPDPNVTIMKKCTVFPVEFVCRGFMTGSTDTSLWTHYKAGAREYCGNAFPDGMRKNDRLAKNVITPTTKAEDHDVPIAPKDIVAQGLMSQADWDTVSQAALALFAFGQAEAAKRGLLLVDTKYEFGKDADGVIHLIDEIHTPDSSRYWLADSYEARHAAGKEPENIDKEFLRLWFRERCDPYKDKVLPEAPKELVVELSKRYVYLYEKITGEQFQVPDLSTPVNDRIDKNVRKALGK